MNLSLVDQLCDPETGAPLSLQDAMLGEHGRIESGRLVAASGRSYAIRHGIPRFVDAAPGLADTVTSFGDQWNHFNFVNFHTHWLQHTVRNTFGSVDAFRDKVIVDAGSGSGAQTLWMLQSGARHVIALELSHSVDGVIQRNLRASGYENWDVIQCSIDAPPLRQQSVDLVMCHNVIQHTPSVERTAHALFALVAPGGEFVFNCYPKNDEGLLRWARVHLLYAPLRAVLSRCPFRVNLAYATVMAGLHLIPGLGSLLEKAGFCSEGEVLTADGAAPGLRRRFQATRLNTFDRFGSHTYQHLKSDDELRHLLVGLQPDATRILNVDSYFSRPAPIGCALRVVR
ncbi:MAG: class I SAM-dependent methyltransferase [Acidobacteriota bacterium]